MNCNGKELKEITDPQVFIPPKKMYVIDELDDEPKEAYVVAIIENGSNYRVIVERDIGRFDGYQKCFEIPEEPKPRRATWKQLAYWLMEGRGLVMDKDMDRVDTGVFFDKKNIDEEVGERWLVMKKDDTEWHEPTVEYMNLEA